MTEEQVQEQSTPDSEATAPKEELKEEEKPEAKYTDKDVDKLKGSARKEGRQSALKDLLEELGVESLDDLKEGYQAYKTIEEETQTEAEKAKADAERFKAERDEAKAATEAAIKLAEERLIKAELKLALIAEGARQDKLAKLLREADLSEVTVEETDGHEEVKNLEPVVKSLQEEEPDWFGSDERASGSRATPPASGPTATQIDKEAKEAELRRIGSAL